MNTQTMFVCRRSGRNALQFIKLFGRNSSVTAAVERRMATLQVEPKRAMIDEPVRITMTGLKPQQPVTLAASVKDDGPMFRSYSYYLADSDGNVDLGAHASSGGTYEGVEPMGLFWSMVPEGGYESGYRMRKKNITEPHRISVSILDGHQEPDTESLKTLLNKMKSGEKEPVSDLNCLSSQLIERWYLADHVQRVMVRHGRIRGVLFIPNGKSGQQSPGIIDMYGTTGGLAEYRAAILASRGFTVLAVAFFNYDDLPKDLSVIDLHYFDELIDYFSSHPNVLPGGIGVIGISKGGELALHMSTVSEKVKAVVAINSFHFFSTATHAYNGKTLPETRPKVEEAEFTPQNSVCLRTAFLAADHIEENTIPLENAKGASFLLIHGTDDQAIDSASGAHMVARLRKHGYNKIELHMYPGTGHLIESPYLPVCPANYHRVEQNKGASLLLLQGVDDGLVDSRCAALIVQRLRKHGLYNFGLHMYPGTGHLLEPPYLPVCPINYHSVFRINMEYGGIPKYHSRASQDSWARILEFFHEKIGNKRVKLLHSHL